MNMPESSFAPAPLPTSNARVPRQAFRLLLGLAIFLAAFPAAFAIELSVSNGDFTDPGNVGVVGGGAIGDAGDASIGTGPWSGQYYGAAGQLPPPTLAIEPGRAVITGLASAGSAPHANNGGSFHLGDSGIPLAPFTRYELRVEFDAGGAFPGSFFADGSGGLELFSDGVVLASSLETDEFNFAFYNLPASIRFMALLRYTTGATVPDGDIGIRLFAHPRNLPPGQIKPTITFHRVVMDVRPLASTHERFVPTAGRPLQARQGPATALLADGTVLVAGGENFYDPPVVKTAELFDPATGTFSQTGSMAVARFAASATPLADGRVLMLGGAYDVPSEIYDPVDRTFTMGPTLSRARAGNAFTTTLLPDGRVLVAGGFGYDEEWEDVILPYVDIFDPETGQFSTLPDLSTPRSGHTATLLPDGRVLIASGYNQYFSPDPSAEIFDPLTGTSSPTGALQTGREGAVATLLADGRVLIAGGFNAGAGRHLRSAEIYDPQTGTFSPAGDMLLPRYAGTAKLLPDGRVLIVASVSPEEITGGGIASAAAEVYDPESGTFSPVESMTVPRDYASSIILPDGRVLMTTGFSHKPTAFLRTAEVFSPLDDGHHAGPDWDDPRADAAVVPMLDGTLLVTGGSDASGPSRRNQRFDPSHESFSPFAPLVHARAGHAANLLADGQVVVTGGGVRHVEVYQPHRSRFVVQGALSVQRSDHASTALADGRLLVSGGQDGGTALASAEIYDARTGLAQEAGSLNQARSGHASLSLPNGNVLVVGGGPATAEWYDPIADAFVDLGPTVHLHPAPALTLLRSGKVLVTGGARGSAELFDPVTAQFSDLASASHARQGHTAAMLGDGRVLLSGGGAPSELFDPVTGQFGPVSSTDTDGARRDHHAALLQDGRVLLLGGTHSGALYASTQFYDPGTLLRQEQRPQIASVAPAYLQPPHGLVVQGAGFRGSSRGPDGAIVGSEASGGTANGASTSATNFPLVQLRHVESGQHRYLVPSRESLWTDDRFISDELTQLPAGVHEVTVIVNGIPSISRYVSVSDDPPPVQIFSDGLEEY